MNLFLLYLTENNFGNYSQIKVFERFRMFVVMIEELGSVESLLYL